MGTMTASLERGINQKADPRAGKYLMFWLGSEEFAIQVLRVREIMGVREINTVPQTPDYVKGVINLRGKVIPVVDLRLKFGLEQMEYTQRTCIIVVQIEVVQIEVVQIEVVQIEVAVQSELAEIARTPLAEARPEGGSTGATHLSGAMHLSGATHISGAGHIEIGVIVDAVSEVLTLQASDIENTPDFGSGVAIPYLLGMAKIKGKVKILLDINRVLSVEEAAGLGSL
jgi:purine-binding chemotaxis protein CheW